MTDMIETRLIDAINQILDQAERQRLIVIWRHPRSGQDVRLQVGNDA